MAIEDMTVAQLKKECKLLNIKLTKADGSQKLKSDLIKSLSSSNASHNVVEGGARRRRRKSTKKSSRRRSRRRSSKKVSRKRRSRRRSSKKVSRKRRSRRRSSKKVSRKRRSRKASSKKRRSRRKSRRSSRTQEGGMKQYIPGTGAYKQKQAEELAKKVLGTDAVAGIKDLTGSDKKGWNIKSLLKSRTKSSPTTTPAPESSLTTTPASKSSPTTPPELIKVMKRYVKNSKIIKNIDVTSEANLTEQDSINDLYQLGSEGYEDHMDGLLPFQFDSVKVYKNEVEVKSIDNSQELLNKNFNYRVDINLNDNFKNVMVYATYKTGNSGRPMDVTGEVNLTTKNTINDLYEWGSDQNQSYIEKLEQKSGKYYTPKPAALFLEDGTRLEFNNNLLTQDEPYYIDITLSEQ